MLLQIDKTERVEHDVPVVLETDYISGVKRTVKAGKNIKVILPDNEVITIRIDAGRDIVLEQLENDYFGYKILTVYLLNDEGKTLRKLI
ncbi:MAG: hypothetical protein ACLTE9_19225 [Thomasclavelia ramosa]